MYSEDDFLLISALQKSRVRPICKMIAADGKKRKALAANVEGLLRIIQSITSPKAEPFRRSLAQVDYEPLEEIENPELAQTRMREIYTEGVFSPIRDDTFINNSVHL